MKQAEVRISVATLRRRQQGIGMIEVLVALLILSIGVLGYAGLQLRALNSANESHYRAQAMAIAQDVVERIAVNPDARATYLTTTSWQAADFSSRATPTGWDQCFNGSCTAADIAGWDILQARYMAWTLLPTGHVAVSGCATALACVVVAWNDADPTNCDTSTDDCVTLEVMP